MKRCHHCNVEKSDVHYSGDKAQPDGLNALCRDCYSERQHERRIRMKISGKLDERPHSYIPADSF